MKDTSFMAKFVTAAAAFFIIIGAIQACVYTETDTQEPVQETAQENWCEDDDNQFTLIYSQHGPWTMVVLHEPTDTIWVYSDGGIAQMMSPVTGLPMTGEAYSKYAPMP